VSGGGSYARVVSELGVTGATVIDDNTDLLDSGVDVDVACVTAQEHAPNISPAVKIRYSNVFVQATSLYNNASNSPKAPFS
jgi:hypothetical protein